MSKTPVVQVKDPDDYQRQAEATMNPAFDAKGRLGNCALGLCDESFETAEHLFNITSDEQWIFVDPGSYTAKRKIKIIDELGDVLWYAAVLSHALQMPFKDIVYGTTWDTSTLVAGRPPYVAMNSSWHRLCASVAFVGGKIKKHLYQEHPLDEKNRELIRGSLRISVSAVQTMLAVCQSTLNECAIENIRKLLTRYPEGKFSAESSINRVV